MEQSSLWGHQLTHRSGVSTVALSGELDLACAASMQDLLFEQLQLPQVTDLRVDLAQVHFLDSTALGVLVSGFHHAQRERRGFTVVNPSPMAQRLLTLTGLAEVLVPS